MPETHPTSDLLFPPFDHAYVRAKILLGVLAGKAGLDVFTDNDIHNNLQIALNDLWSASGPKNLQPSFLDNLNHSNKRALDNEYENLTTKYQILTYTGSPELRMLEYRLPEVWKLIAGYWNIPAGSKTTYLIVHNPAESTTWWHKIENACTGILPDQVLCAYHPGCTSVFYPKGSGNPAVIISPDGFVSLGNIGTGPDTHPASPPVDVPRMHISSVPAITL